MNLFFLLKLILTSTVIENTIVWKLAPNYPVSAVNLDWYSLAIFPVASVLLFLFFYIPVWKFRRSRKGEFPIVFDNEESLFKGRTLSPSSYFNKNKKI